MAMKEDCKAMNEVSSAIALLKRGFYGLVVTDEDPEYKGPVDKNGIVTIDICAAFFEKSEAVAEAKALAEKGRKLNLVHMSSDVEFRNLKMFSGDEYEQET